ncbi:MAG: hypothetical protein A2845_05650 [Candidatus Lloydbacteria bacterium RIFCSPHIGHO2_01_FULL_49_22]|uniref:Uncharacterized protein n=1 Tax=Candidatus Lloydbacteria bacterium RIFCSPHIGHO2_01_FULL_49_22 TaxID=1798658 RepID=A0A1G2CTU3_9BACT|nr:MAG: hypothetical protein A2845_05650 [Candidatus Lloydbacteria bacterium RIFCSPHIGHO2_01_FULL_49_22]OGZ09681.1 MAG: hypothetical protein A3C14_02960 [Candidatus Lloydbacteria bacterium RIFCSPHIGHO2_02_FULL_50_18]
MLKRYIEYLKDNPHGYWFKRKLFGWGWTPVTWQGWLAIVLYVAALLRLSLTLDENSSTRETFFNFMLPFVLLTVLLLICYRKGERPRWQWGIPKKTDGDTQ